MLLLQDCILTIDAMGCQTEIAFKIVEKGAAYILAVKENQKQLYQDIRDEFRFVKDIQTAISENLDHGRIETKKCSVITNFEHFERALIRPRFGIPTDITCMRQRLQRAMRIASRQANRRGNLIQRLSTTVELTD